MAIIQSNRGLVAATITVPGSKSLANRALIIGGLAGHSAISNVPDGDDCVAMVRAITALGAGIGVSGSTVAIGEAIDRERTSPLTLDAQLAGTTSRFLVGLASVIAGPTTISGEEALRRRPMGDLLDALTASGAHVVSADGRLPVTISRAGMSGGNVSIPGRVSSQFISALMMIAPYLAGGLVLNIEGDQVSASYIALTASVMRHFGVNPTIRGSRIEIPHGSYRPANYEVAPDASSASYPLAMAAVRGGTVRVPRLRRATDQGDYRIVQLLEQSGCTIAADGEDIVLTRDPSKPLQAVNVDMRDCSDLVPTWAIVAAFSTGATRISGIGFIRNKESDRIGDLANELRKLGVQITELDDGLEIIGGEIHGGEVRTHDDHRLAMAFGVLGTVIDGVSLDDRAVVSKSWPSYWETMGIATSS